MKKLIILSVLFLSSYISFSQILQQENVHIEVPSNIDGSTEVSTNEIAIYKFNFGNIKQWRWNVHGGIIIKSSKNEVTIKWTSKKNKDQAESLITTAILENGPIGGSLLSDHVSPFSSSEDIEHNGQISFSFAYVQDGLLKTLRQNLDVNILYNPTPNIPIIKRRNCNEYILEKLPEPHADLIWYWQGQNSEGTSTSNAATTFRATQSGTYYLRGYNSIGRKFSLYSIPFEVQLKNCVGAPSDDENYVHSTTYKTPYKEHELSSVSVNNKLEQTTYYDALGRPKQTVAIRAGGTKKDIITHIEYDTQGRKEKEYLPYSDGNTDIGYRNTNVPLAIQTYYKNKFPTDFNSTTPTQEINAYAQKVYDHSPLNRVLQQAAPGHDWKAHGGHTVDFNNDFNTSKDLVKKYNVSLIKQGQLYSPTLVPQGNYTKGELYKSTVKDENHDGTASKLHTIEEFKNSRGQVVLKRTFALTNTLGLTIEDRHDTYYVYDDFGNLTYVIPPKVNTFDGISTTGFSELCYQYKYDYRNRLIEKKTPGKGWEYIVYDKLDRPVLIQDALQKLQKKWLFTKYDKLGRVIYTGIYTHGSTYSQAQMQNYFTTVNNTSVKHYETKQSSAGSLGIYYSNSDFPTTNLEVLTVRYYDNYIFNRAGAGTSVSNIYGVNSTSRLKGLVTGVRVKVLGTSNWITTVTYYDDKARPIYVYSKNDFLLSTDIVKNKLDFTGKVIETITQHNKTDDDLSTITTNDKFEYDHMERLEKQTQTIGNTTEIIVSNIYDELGQLKNKGVGGKTTQPRLQTVDYKYNVRGWLKEINNITSLGSDLFGFKINYNTVNHSGTKLFNGNISETEWKTKSDNQLRWYKYEYDALNRITSAIDNNNRYSLSNVEYDKNGNISKLERRGHRVANPDKNISSHFGLMDNLQYFYSSDSNKLTRVQELSGGHSTYGFKNGSNASIEYTYDANGNMLKDLNKGINSDITYNHLNLPTKITLAGGNIQYFYDATGVKQRKIASTGTTTDYAGNYVYEKNGFGTKKLQFFNHPEGYVKNDNGTFNYVYQYKDHLGNIRLSYTDNDGSGDINPATEIIEESNYYPFGLEHKGYNGAINGVQHKYEMYNGVEYEESLGLNLYEMDVRMYDPTIARFNGIDPVTHFSQGTSVAFDNNPVYWADPSGADSWTYVSDGLYENDQTGSTTYDWEMAISQTQEHLGENSSGTSVSSSGGISADGNKKESSGNTSPISKYAKAFGKSIHFTYELLDDENNRHKIILSGNTWINGGTQRRQLIEIIIEVNNRTPRIVSSILTGGIYSKINGDPDKNGITTQFWSKIKGFKTQNNFESPLVDYVSKPLLNTLNQNPDYNPFNGSVNSNKTTDIITGIFTASKAATGKDPLTYLLGKTISRLYYAAAGGVALGNLYRNSWNHTGRSIKFKLY